MEYKKVIIYTDGACSGNPGPGGWGAYLKYNNTEKDISGFEKLTTNNRMELTAAIRALQILKSPCEIDLYCDSSYVINGITKWIFNWRKKGWKDVKNPDLWQELDLATKGHKITWRWVKGHDGNYGNERADSLARGAIESNL